MIKLFDTERTELTEWEREALENLINGLSKIEFEYVLQLITDKIEK